MAETLIHLGLQTMTEARVSPLQKIRTEVRDHYKQMLSDRGLSIKDCDIINTYKILKEKYAATLEDIGETLEVGTLLRGADTAKIIDPLKPQRGS